ncbi:MAG: hypothetical protein CM15mP74_28710 [Halieaceae bacterium]|nr:MAG: hypothetical protein CM15mP74_28710 [Halieaceae bacterium]
MTRKIRGLRHLVVQKNLDIPRRLVGGKDPRRAVVPHRVRQRLVVGKIREDKTSDEVIEGLRIRHPVAAKQDGAVSRELFHERRRLGVEILRRQRFLSDQHQRECRIAVALLAGNSLR